MYDKASTNPTTYQPPADNPMLRLQQSAADWDLPLPKADEALAAYLLDPIADANAQMRAGGGLVETTTRTPLSALSETELRHEQDYARRMMLVDGRNAERRRWFLTVSVAYFTRQGYHPVSHGVLVAERARGAA